MQNHALSISYIGLREVCVQGSTSQFVQTMIGRTDGGRRSAEGIITPIVLVPDAILSIKLLIEMRIINMYLVGANPYD